MKTNNLLILAKSTLILILCTLAYIISQRLISLKEQQIRNQAIDTCLQNSGIYEYTNPDKQVKTTAPQKEYYITCLSDKGYSSTWE